MIEQEERDEALRKIRLEQEKNTCSIRVQRSLLTSPRVMQWSLLPITTLFWFMWLIFHLLLSWIVRPVCSKLLHLIRIFCRRCCLRCTKCFVLIRNCSF